MKILRIVATGFAELGDHYTLDFLPKAKVNEDDYENEVYALSKEIDYPHCVAFIGKNGSGKSTALRLIKCVYEILDTGHLAYQKELFKKGVISLDVVYVVGDKVRRYVCSLTRPEDLDSGYVPLVLFFDEHTYAKKVNPRRGKSQFLEGYDEDTPQGKRLPEDTSILKMLPSEATITSCFYSFPKPLSSESVQSSLLSMSTLEEPLQKAILRLLDASLEKLSFDPALGLIRFKRVHEEERLLLPEEASKLLSDGTKRGLSLFSLAAHALLRGSALVVDELEDNIHKYLARTSAAIALVVSTLKSTDIYASTTTAATLKANQTDLELILKEYRYGETNARSLVNWVNSTIVPPMASLSDMYRTSLWSVITAEVDYVNKISTDPTYATYVTNSDAALATAKTAITSALNNYLGGN
jgi:energy-coupling factor transporter ATP-binding protein EcfA2